MGGSSKDHRDVYYRLSKIDGYRARSAYKLLHLDEQYGFFGQREAYTLEKGLKEELASLVRLRDQRRQSATSEDDEEDLVLLEEEIEDLHDVLEYAAKLPSSSSSPATQPQRPTRAVDLCAAPGSWSQVLVQRLPPSSHIVSVDLQPMAPIPGVRQILGDITTRETAEAVARALAGEEDNEAEAAKAQLIVCDGAPDVTGIHSLDEMLQAQLLLSALQITMRLLEPGGTFIAKIFCQGGLARPGTAAATAAATAASASASLSAPAASHVSAERVEMAKGKGDTSELLVRQMKELFELVDVAKPRSSRIASHEHFIVCRNFRPPPQLVTPSALATPLHDLASQYLSTLAADPTNKEVRDLAQTTGLIAGGDLSAWMERPVARGQKQVNGEAGLA